MSESDQTQELQDSQEDRMSLESLAELALPDQESIIQVQTQEIERLRGQIAEVTESARIDIQTGLYNKNAYIEMLYPVLMHSFRTGKSLGAIAMDLQGLKKINDEEGHEEGDNYIAKFGQSIKEVMAERKRTTDLGFRVGGDEVILLLPDTDAAGVKTAAEDYSRMLTDRKVKTGIGAGIVDVTDLNSMMGSFRSIDQALYASKKQGYATGENNVQMSQSNNTEGLSAA